MYAKQVREGRVIRVQTEPNELGLIVAEYFGLVDRLVEANVISIQNASDVAIEGFIAVDDADGNLTMVIEHGEVPCALKVTKHLFCAEEYKAVDVGPIIQKFSAP